MKSHSSRKTKEVPHILEQAREITQDAWEETRAQGQEAWADVGELIQKHPAKALGVAAFAGLVFGSLLFKRR